MQVQILSSVLGIDYGETVGDTKARYYRIKQECIDRLGGKCARCSSTEMLEFDHIDPRTKEFCIIGGSRISRERLMSELAKCQLLCKACHAAKTAEDQAVSRFHGSKTMWNRGCKCGECREGQRLRMAAYYKAKRAGVVESADTLV